MGPEENEEARRELIRRGVLKESTEDPPDPHPDPTPPSTKSSLPCRFGWHRWTPWRQIQVTVMIGAHCAGEKTHQRRECSACGIAQVAEVFV